MMDFKYNGRRASEFGLRISSVNTFGAPERVMQEYQIPGYSPHVYIQDERKTTAFIRQYDVALVRSQNLPAQTAAIKQWLYNDGGQMQRLEDTYQPDVFRKARFSGSFDTEWMGGARRSIQFQLTFVCQPQLWYKSGEQWLDIKDHWDSTKCMWLQNPSGCNAHPLIKISFGDVDDTTRGVELISPHYWCVLAKEESFDDHVKGKTFYIDTETEDIWEEPEDPSDPIVYANQYFDIQGDLYVEQGGAIFCGSRYGHGTPSPLENSSLLIQPRWWRW